MKMTVSKQFRWLIGILLIFGLVLTLGLRVSRDRPLHDLADEYSDDVPGDFAIPPREIEEIASENSQGEVPANQSDRPDSPATQDESELERDWITRTIDESWLDGPEKLADRRRIRIVEADFKYPHIRLEESVSTDPGTGKESATLIRASVADHLMVGLRDGVDPEQAAAAMGDLGYTVRDVQPGSFILAEIPSFSAAEDHERAIVDLSSLNEFIDFAEPDWIVNTMLTPDDPAIQQGRMWALGNPGRVAGTVPGADIDARAGWAERTDASEVIVAVTDTGIRYTHEDLAPNMWTDAHGRFGIDAYDENDDPMDPNGHGTHCAGTIGARGNNSIGIAGVAWDVRLMALRFIGPFGGTNSDAIRVINYARENGAHIINASWGGGGYSQGLHNAIEACHEAGIIFVAAAGNQSSDNDALPMYPASYRLPNIVSVAATNSADELTVFSNFGKNHVHLAAPGHDIWSCGIASDTDYRYLSGTSMAAPHVAGALALARAHFPSESASDLVTRLHSAVDELPWLDGEVATGGRLNLRRLLLESDPVPPHDSFDTPFWFRGSDGFWTGVNERASREPGEDAFSPDTGSRSLWFRWTAPDDGLVRFTATVGTGDVSVVAFRGDTRESLARVDDNFANRPDTQGHLYFYAEAAETYTFSVDSRHATAQRLKVEFGQQPANDNFHDAHDLDTTPRIEVRASNRGATAESFELAAPHAGVGAGKSVWWRWTPSFTGEFILTTRFSPFDTVLAVYQGDSPDALTEVASNDDRRSFDWTSEVQFHVNAGTTYHIAVDSYRGTSSGNIILNGYRPGALAILNHPQSQVVRSGDSALMRVVATGNNLRFQWELDGAPIPGATSPLLRIRNASAQDFGSYRVRVSSPSASLMSNSATLSEFVTPPGIQWQTRSRSISTGDSIDLRVRASGTPPFSYQWYRNDIEIEGATSDMLRFEDVDASVEAGYSVVVTNLAGSKVSERIVLRVFDTPWENFDFIDPASQSQAVFAVEYHEGLWLAASRTGDLDGIRFSTSDDGKNWNHQIIEPELPHRSVTGMFLVRGNGFWLCGGSGTLPTGVFYRSTDRLEWERIHINIPLNFGSSINSSSQMLFHAGHFYLTAGNRVYRSENAIDWVKQTTPGGNDIQAYRMAAGPPGVLVEGTDSVQALFLATGSDSWQELIVDPTKSGISGRITDVLWNVDHFVAYNPSSSIGYSSANGVDWSPGANLPNGVRYATWRANNGNLSFAGGWGPQDFLSIDGGLTWTAYTRLFPPNTRAVAIDDEGLAVFGSAKGALVAVDDLFATPGQYAVPMFTNALDDLVYEGGQFIATHHDTIIAVSADGETWTTGKPKNIPSPGGLWAGLGAPLYIEGEYWRPGFPKQTAPFYPYLRGPVPSASVVATLPSAPDDSLTAIAGGPAGIVAIRTHRTNMLGQMVRSTDGGTTWEEITAPGSTPYSSAKLTSVNGVYFYNATFGEAYISTDLEHWTNIGDFTHLVYHEGEYWALHQTWVKKSTDLVYWTDPVPTGMEWFGKPVSFNGAVVAPIGGRLHYSYDGTNWVHVPTAFRVARIAASDNVMLLASSSGHLVRMGASRLAPVVAITEPTEEAVFVEGGRILVNVEAYHPDEEGDPVVRGFYDGQLIGELSAPPYEFMIPSGGAGGHLIHVECQLGDGPVSLATRHILVQPSHLVNRLSGSDGSQALPGQIVYRNGIYISYHANGFMGSIDGRDWHAIAMPAMMSNVTGIVEGNGRLIAHGEFSATNIAVSRDGVNWVGSKLPKANRTPLYFSHGYFWGITSGGASSDGVLLSEDGLNWTLRDIMIRPANILEAAGNPNGILLGRASSNLWRSADGGRTWAQLQGFGGVNGLSYDGERFHVRAQIDGERFVGSSLDGLNWDWSAPDARFQQLQVVDGTSFVFNTLNRLVAISHDGLEWLEVPGEPRTTHITRGADGYYYAVIQLADSGVQALHRSANGLEWETRAPLPTTGTFHMFATPDGLFISPGNGALWVMEWDANEWSQPFSASAGITTILNVETGGGKLLAIANNGTHILHSTDDGTSWSTSFDVAGSGLPSSLRLNRLMYLDGVWLAWHKGVALLRSDDGESFTNITNETAAATFGGLAHNGEHWMAIRDDGAVVTSDDGLAWKIHSAPGSYPDGRAHFLTSHQGVWYAVSPDSSGGWNAARLLSSPDGLAWAPTSMPNITTTGVVAFAATNGRMIVGAITAARYTPDLVTWTNTSASTSVFAHDDAFYLIRNGWLERSDDGTSWRQVHQVGNTYTLGKFIGGRLHLYGGSNLAILTGHDMAVLNVRGNAADHAVGDTVEVEFTLSNEGEEIFPAGDYDVEVFLSADGFYGNEDDAPMGRAVATAPQLLPGESAVLSVEAIIPNLTPPGSYHVGVYFDRDGASRESNRSNNFGMSAARPVQIAGWLLTTSVVGEGEVNRDSTQRLFANGSRVSLNATSGKGAAFNGWLGDAYGTESQVTILMDGDKDVQASFVSQVNLQVVIRGHGHVSGTGDGGAFLIGDTAEIQAVPGDGWEFAGWTGAANGTQPSRSILMDEAKSVTAKFILPLEHWRALHFNEAELQDPSISGDDADADGDGFTNLQEYLHGTNPKNAESTGIIRTSMDGGHLSIIFTRLVGAEDGWMVSSQASRDLFGWNASGLQERMLGTENGIETVEARLPHAGGASGFLRLKYHQSNETD